MIEGKTKRGFAYAIAEENVDQEFLDALAEAEDGQPLKVSKALRLLPYDGARNPDLRALLSENEIHGE